MIWILAIILIVLMANFEKFGRVVGITVLVFLGGIFLLILYQKAFNPVPPPVTCSHVAPPGTEVDENPAHAIPPELIKQYELESRGQPKPCS